jgi:hypothetical protein
VRSRKSCCLGSGFWTADFWGIFAAAVRSCDLDLRFFGVFGVGIRVLAGLRSGFGGLGVGGSGVSGLG